MVKKSVARKKVLQEEKREDRTSKVKITLDLLFKEYTDGSSGSYEPMGSSARCIILDSMWSMNDDEN